MEQQAQPKGRVITDEDARHITRVEELAYDLQIADNAAFTISGNQLLTAQTLVVP